MAGYRAIASLAWRRWVFRFALVSFVGLYSIGLLPHSHGIDAGENCAVCHAVQGLSSLSADFSPPKLEFRAPVLHVLLVLPRMAAAFDRPEKLFSPQRSRAPPLP